SERPTNSAVARRRSARYPPSRKVAVSSLTVPGYSMQRSVTLGPAEDQVGNAAALGVQLALPGQPVAPRGVQVLVRAGHAAETDVGHPLARLGGAAVVIE